MRRHAIPADLDRVFDIHMHKAAMPFLGSDPMPREAFGRVFDPLLDSGCFCVFEVEGRVQGFYTGATVSWSRRACRPSGDAGGGTGSARQRHCRRDDGRRPHPSAQSRRHPGELTVEADNPRAITFYERFGFAHEGTQRAACKRACDEAHADGLMYGLLLNEQ